MIERFACVVAACFVLAACHSQAADRDPQGHTTTSGATGTPGTPTLLSQTPPAAPEGVATELTATVDEDGGCSRVPDASPFLYTDPRTELGMRARVCLFGFDGDGTLVFTAEGPAGKDVEITVDSADLPAGRGVAFHWVAPPHAMTGNWQLEARLGDDVDGDNIAVGTASYPHVTIDASPLDVVPRIAAGEPVDITLTGFVPDEDAMLHLYRAGEDHDGEFSYIATLTVPTDEAGTGATQVATHAGDPAGLYCFAYPAANFDAGQICGSAPFRLT